MNVRTAVLLVGTIALCAPAGSAFGDQAGAGGGQPQAKPAAAPVVLMKTSMGEIKIRLAPDKAPSTVENFLGYVNDKFYDGTIFHRVIASFMIQGGGFTPDMNKKPTKAPSKLEAQTGLKNKRGTIAMARTNDPHSATCQFFINVVDNGMLDAKSATDGYAVFGEVVSGMDVVDKIKAVPTGQKAGMQDVPLTPVVIESVRVVPAS
jgi:cyclophilin family peptidyl-prolyl cis-trans isomerase